jgi:hypothetical protein
LMASPSRSALTSLVETLKKAVTEVAAGVRTKGEDETATLVA